MTTNYFANQNAPNPEQDKLRISFFLNLRRYPQFAYLKNMNARGAYPDELIRLALLGLKAEAEAEDLLRATREATLAALAHSAKMQTPKRKALSKKTRDEITRIILPPEETIIGNALEDAGERKEKHKRKENFNSHQDESEATTSSVNSPVKNLQEIPKPSPYKEISPVSPGAAHTVRSMLA